MSILLKELRVHGFRGLKNCEIDFKPITVLVGVNNAGKTTILKALQIALSNSFQVTDDDFFHSETENLNKIVIDVLFISVNTEGKQINKFDKKWKDVFKANRILVSDEKELLAFRTVIEKDSTLKSIREQFLIDEWGKFEDGKSEFWYQKQYGKKLNFYFDEIPFLYIDANRDILEDLKYRSSFLGKILSSLKYNDDDTQEIEQLIEELNKATIEKSKVLTMLQDVLKGLDAALDNGDKQVEITPFMKKLRDLSKGVKINYSHFSMEYHGMGTRSWSSLLTLKAFVKQQQDLTKGDSAYYPIIAIEEPESHLHPHAQNKLYTQIAEMVGQKIVSTHSSYIARSANLKEIRSIIKDNDIIKIGKIEQLTDEEIREIRDEKIRKIGSKIEQLTDKEIRKIINEEISIVGHQRGKLTDEDIRKVRRQVINTRGELFFAKVIIFCEGETEEQMLPLLMTAQHKESVTALGVSVVGVGGGGNYLPFMLFAESFGLKWFIFSDGEEKIQKDLLGAINKLPRFKEAKELPDNVVCLDNGMNMEVYLLNQADFNKEITQCLEVVSGDSINPGDSLKKLLDNHKATYSTVLAELMIESNKEFPSKFIDLYNKIKIYLPVVTQSNESNQTVDKSNYLTKGQINGPRG